MNSRFVFVSHGLFQYDGVVFFKQATRERINGDATPARRGEKLIQFHGKSCSSFFSIPFREADQQRISFAGVS
jgi:hypothetical protein